MAITLDGTSGITTPDVNSDGLTVDTTTLVVDEANNRVGIGTSSPSDYKLHLYRSGANLLKLESTTATALIDFANSGGSGTVVSQNNNMWFNTNGTERARIDSSGALLVGTTSNSGEGWTFEAVGYGVSRKAGTADSVHWSFKRGSNTEVGKIQSNGSSTSYVTSSDYRLKENVVGVTGASARVQQLNPVRFNFIADPDRTVDGFLAHEVQDVVPEAISGTKDATEMVDVHDEDGNVTGQEERPVYQGIDQSKLVPLLTAALQEALTKIETLEARVAALEAA
jgi:hypothetical protein